MNKGGYQILNLSGYDFRINETQHIPNVYDVIEGTHKVILISGASLNGIEIKDAFVNFIVSAGNFVADIGNIRVTVGSSADGNDPVTITTI